MPSTLLDAIESKTISPYEELLSVEYLYAQPGSSLRGVADATVLSERLPHEVASDRFGLFEPDDLWDLESWLAEKLGTFSVAVNRTPSWPSRLADSKRPTPILYYRGDIGLLEAKNVSVVGARKATFEGKARAASLAKSLAESEIAVTTGLAAGIDTAAATSAIEHGGKTIGVIGTPIDECYPKENRGLQDRVARDGLLISQVPLYKYSRQPFETKRYYFPERNELMAAVSDATVIVEASDTSGTLSQARACLGQGRPLFIMRSCVESKDVSWPSKYIGREGVHVLDSAEQLLEQVYG